MKKIVIIPDSFKGSMTSREISTIIAEEAAARWPQIQTTCIQVADGGEGSVDAFLSVLPGEKKMRKVRGPYNEELDSFYGVIDEGQTAVIEMAAAAGLPLVGEHRDAGKTSTYGVGQLIQAALNDGVKKVILGLGGSATNDGGVGAAAALGVRFLNAAGEEFLPVGETLSQIARIDVRQADPRLKQVEMIAMCDIDNPLCGEHGASAVFGPQKGASPEQVLQLDAGLAHLAKLIWRDIGVDVLNMEGAGAAGGMGAGMVAFMGASLQRGIDVVLDTVGYDEMLTDCSMVITGEGRIDGQSARGKVVAGVASRASQRNIPVLAVVGDIGDDADEMYKIGVSAIFSINRVAVPFSEAKSRAAGDLRKTIRTIFKWMELAKEIE